jgi:hypothetical protein
MTMKKIIVAAGLSTFLVACGGEQAGSNASGEAVTANAARPDHDEAVPTPPAEGNHGHEHQGNEAEHSH